MKFAVLLKKLRKQHGITQRKLAEKIGVDFTYISKIESEKMPPPSESTILKMAEVFGIDAEDMVLSAGKIPESFEKVIFNNREVLEYLKEKIKEGENTK